MQKGEHFHNVLLLSNIKNLLSGQIGSVFWESGKKSSLLVLLNQWRRPRITRNSTPLKGPLGLPSETVCEYEVQYHQRLEQERAQWNQYRESVERELGELRRRLTEGQEEENLEDAMKKVGFISTRFTSTPSCQCTVQQVSFNISVSKNEKHE